MLPGKILLAAFSDVISLSVTGIIVVLSGLALLSIAVALFKFVIPGASKGPIQKEMSEESSPETIEKVHHLDEDQLAAIATAVTIEWKLYHEEPNKEYTFDYRGERLSSWTMSEYIAE